MTVPLDRFGGAPQPYQGANADELRRLGAEVARRRERVKAVVLELEDLRVALRRTETTIHVHVGHLYVELEQVRLAIRMQSFRNELVGLPGMDEAEIQRLARAKFAADEERVDELERERRDSLQEKQSVERMEGLAPETVKSIKALYRKLAQRFHPDLHMDDRNRAAYEGIMARLNECYRDLDLQGMLDIQDGVSITLVDVEEERAERLARLGRVAARLEQIELDARRELGELREHELYETMIEIERGRDEGRDVIAHLEDDLRGRIAILRAELARAKEAGDA